MCIYFIFTPFFSLYFVAHQIVSRTNDTTTKIIQPEIIFPARTDTNGHNERERNGPNSIPIDRKGTLAIGQSFSYTDLPPNEYGISKGKITS